MPARSMAVTVLARIVLLGITTLVCLTLTELALRLVLDEVNLLKPRIVDDPVLGHRVAEGSAGHDPLGLRNTELPERIDILAVGDSQTYGVSALATQSWPAWLARETGRSVYNMALGGYGPIQYEYLLREHGLSMEPSVVVLGFYFGNDLFDASRVVYGLDHWAELRSADSGVEVTRYKSVENRPSPSLPASVQVWLSHNSMIYRLVVTAAGQLLGRMQVATGNLPSGVTNVNDPDLQTAFTPGARLDAIDLATPEIREGLRLTLEAIDRIHALCMARGIRLMVLLVPTKESVFEAHLRGRPELAFSEEIARLFENEALVRRAIADHLEDRGIEAVDPRPAMRSASTQGPIYPSNHGGHPVSSGYRAIARSIADRL